MTALMLIGYLEGALPPMPQDAPDHHRVPSGGGTALCMDVNPDDAGQEAGVLVWAERQNAILSAYARSLDVIPVSLGAVFSDTGAVAAHVTRDASLSQRAAALRGFCEYSLHIEKTPPASEATVSSDDASPSGAGFLLRRRQVRDARRSRANDRAAFIGRMVAVVEGLAQETAPLPRSQPGRLLDTAILILRSDTDRLTAQLTQVAEGSEALSLTCRLIGPGPVFSFLPPVSREASCHA